MKNGLTALALACALWLPGAQAQDPALAPPGMGMGRYMTPEQRQQFWQQRQQHWEQMRQRGITPGMGHGMMQPPGGRPQGPSPQGGR